MATSVQNNQTSSRCCSSVEELPQRFSFLCEWLAEIECSGTIEKIAGDASWRKFYRIQKNESKEWQSAIAIDAPPPHEDVNAIAIALDWFSVNEKLKFPKIYAIDIKKGFALVEDFGDELVQFSLNNNEKLHYKNLIIGLAQMQTTDIKKNVPLYDETLLLSEMALFEEWLIGKHLKISLSTEQLELFQNVKKTVVKEVLNQQQCLVHRDFHSKNILFFGNSYGVVDFQDACKGAYTYDLVSLLRDAYHKTDHLNEWLHFFFENGEQKKDFSSFQKDFHWTCIQRQLKVAGIFYRLWLRDGKDSYLKYIPLVFDYLLTSINAVPLDKDFALLIRDIRAMLCKQ